MKPATGRRFVLLTCAVCLWLIGQATPQAPTTPKKQSSSAGKEKQRNTSVEIALSNKTLRSILITRMAERDYQLRDESEHLLKFQTTRPTPRTVRLTLVDVGESVRVLLERQAPQDVVELLGAIKTDADAANFKRVGGAVCSQLKETAQDRVNEMGQSLMKLGCYPAEPGLSEACKTYWKRYREGVVKEQESLKGCSSTLSSLSHPQAN